MPTTAAVVFFMVKSVLAAVSARLRASAFSVPVLLPLVTQFPTSITPAESRLKPVSQVPGKVADANPIQDNAAENTWGCALDKVNSKLGVPLTSANKMPDALLYRPVPASRTDKPAAAAEPAAAETVVVAAIEPGAMKVDGMVRVGVVVEPSDVIWLAVPNTEVTVPEPEPVPQAAPAVVMTFLLTNFTQSLAAMVPVERTVPPVEPDWAAA